MGRRGLPDDSSSWSLGHRVEGRRPPGRRRDPPTATTGRRRPGDGLAVARPRGATGMRRRRVARSHDGRSVRDRRGSRRGPPPNRRGEATVRRIGMEWVGETEKYFGLRLQVYRLRRADVGSASPRRADQGHRPAECVRPSLVSPSERPAVRPGSRASGGAVASTTRLNRRAARTTRSLAGGKSARRTRRGGACRPQVSNAQLGEGADGVRA